MQKNLIIFEYTDEVETFIAQRSFDELKSENVHILAIQPDIQAYLKRRNILYYNTARFFSKKSHQNILLKSAEIIEPFRRLLNIKDCLGVEEGYSNSFIFYLRQYTILYLLWLTEIVHNTIEQLKPEKIIAVKRDNYLDVMDCIPENERYLGIIVEKLAKEKRIQIELLPARRKHFNTLINKTKTLSINLLKIIIFRYTLLLFRCKVKGRKIVLYSSRSYNLEKVVDSFLNMSDDIMSVLLNSNNAKDDFKNILSFNKYRNMLVLLPVFLPGKMRRSFSRELNSSISRLKDFFLTNKQILRYKGVDLQGLVFSKIKMRMIPFLINLYGQTYNLDKLLKNIKPALVLSQTSRGIYYNLGELASLHNVPSVLISHGSHVPPSNSYADIEWKEHGMGLMNTHYEYLAIQSPWALSYLKNKPSSSTPIVTAPLLFTKTNKGKDIKSGFKRKIIPQNCDNIVILHASSPKPSQSIRPIVYETIDEYIENINSLINVVDKLEGIHLIVRFRPSDYLKLNDFLELLIESSCYSIHADGSFSDYLAISDLLVSYSSTTIEEALQNRVPVLQYDSHGKYCHIQGQILEPSLKPELDSCYYVNSEDNLLWAIKWLLENHFTKDIPDNVWERHVFNDSEKVELPSYFSELFLNDK